MKTTWTKLPALEGGPNPCLCCPPIRPKLALTRRIAVGFGDAGLECDGKRLWDEGRAEYEDCMTVEAAEAKAAADPDHDWRIVMNGPMHGETYQRQGAGEWLLVLKNEGFA